MLRLENEIVEIYLINKINEIEEFKLITTYYFEILSKATNEIVGRTDLRVGMTKELFYYGNIGYTVYPEYRGNNYAYFASLLIFEVAKKMKMKEIIITCSPDNTASFKTCQKLGGVYDGEVEVPRKHPLAKIGENTKSIFRYSLK